MSSSRRPPRFDRRTALKGLGAASVAPFLPGCGSPSDPVPTVLLRERIDTVVVLMMENRSFDHYLGAYSLLEGRADIDGLAEGMSNPHPEGGDVAIHPVDLMCIPDPPHGWSASHLQFHDGANDGFVAEHYARHGAAEAHRVMGWLGRDTLSSTYAIADSGVICDAWFCSLMSSTWPNRYYSLAAQNGGVHGNEFPDTSFPNIFERVRGAGLDWANYYGNAPFSMLLPGTVLTDPRYRPLEDFFQDAQYGLLPPLTWIDPIFGRNDDHPPAHPVAGQILIGSIYQALATSPQWDRCLFVVTYDEHGGFFDHVPPPTAADERADEGFDRLGFRVPTLVVGPWVRQGTVSHTVYDHTSTLAFLETLWDLEPLTERDAGADDLTSLLDVERMAADEPAGPVTIPQIEADEDEIYGDECAYSFRESHPITLQPELEAALDGPLAGTPHDRRAETDRIYEDVLSEAARLGVLRRV